MIDPSMDIKKMRAMWEKWQQNVQGTMDSSF